MGKRVKCWRCGEIFDTGRFANPYGVEKCTYDCPQCGAKNSVTFRPRWATEA